MADKSNYDFQDLLDKIHDSLKEKEGWGDAYLSTVGEVLIRVNAEAADILSYMLERRTQEDYINTARLRSSVVSRASELGYRPYRSISSQGTLRIDLYDENGDPKPVEPGGKITINEGEIFEFDGESFIASRTVEIQEGQSSVQVPVQQGEIVEETFDPNDYNLENFNYILIEDYESIAEGSITVISDSVEFIDVRDMDKEINLGSLSFITEVSTDDGNFYDIRYAHDGMRIQFGSNDANNGFALFGKKPTEPVTVRYIKTKGRDVRVVSIDNDFDREAGDVLIDDLPVTPPNEYEIEVSNITPISGGRPAESVEEIKINAPLFLTSNNRATGIASYNFWVNRSGIGGIIDARAFTETELNTLLYNLNNLYIAYLTEEGNELSTVEKEQLIEFMKERDCAVSHIVPTQAKEIQLGLDISFKRERNLPISQPELYDIIADFIKDHFRRRRGSIGWYFHKSDLIKEFYKITARSGGVDFPITDFVDIKIDAVQGFESVPESSNVIVTLADSPIFDGSFGYDVPDGMIGVANLGGSGSSFVGPSEFGEGLAFSIEINGHTVTVNTTSSDLSGNTAASLIFKMRDAIYQETNVIPEVLTQTFGGNTFYAIRLSAKDEFGDLVVEKKVGDYRNFVNVNYQLAVPPRVFKSTDNVILPGSLKILTSENTVIYEDNGNGVWVSNNGELVDPNDGVSNNPSISIDYVKGKMFLPPIIAETEDEEFYLTYKQDDFDNFKANDGAAVTLIPPKDSLSDQNDTPDNELFTKIRIIQ